MNVEFASIYQYELREYGGGEGRDVVMPQVESQQSAGADVLSVRGMKCVTEAVVPGPQVVDVCGPPGLVVGEVGGVRGPEDLTLTLRPAQSPLALGSNSNVDGPVLVVLRVAVLVHRVHRGAVQVGWNGHIRQLEIL